MSLQKTMEYAAILRFNETELENGIRLMNFEVFKAQNAFARFLPDDSLTVTLDFINRSEVFIVYISHRWVANRYASDTQNGKTAPTEWRKDMFHPDDAENSNYKLCVKGIEKAWKCFAPGMDTCYVWIDYTCLDQDAGGGSPAKELKHLVKIVEVSDCLFTPIHDRSLLDNNEDLPATKDYLEDFPSKVWRGLDPDAYLNRAWCRLEMFYNSYVPTLDYCNSEKREEQVVSDRYTKFKGRMSFQLFNGRRPHLLYTSYEETLDLPPIFVPPMTAVYEHKFNPRDGYYSCSEDKEVGTVLHYVLIYQRPY